MPGTARGWLAPSKVLPAVLVLFAAVLLFGPHGPAATGALTTYDASPAGTRALYDVLGRLGYRVGRLLRPMREPLPTDATYVVLAPAEPLTDGEINTLLAAVRGGAGLVVALNDPRLVDSLGFELTPSFTQGGGMLEQTVVAGGAVGGRGENDGDTDVEGDDGTSLSLRLYPISWTVSLHDSAAPGMPLMWLPGVGKRRASRPIVLGRTFGHGRVVAIAEGDLLRNRILRDGRPAAAVVRAIDWIGGGDRPVVFDEYHQGFGPHASVPRTVASALTDTTIGRMTLQAAVAALVLVLALAARPLAPTDPLVVARRSPLEHVGALAHAYAAVDARAVAAARLVGGLRRRHPAGVARTATPERYLTLLRSRFPSASDDVDVLLGALRGAGDARASAIAASVARVEDALHPLPRSGSARTVPPAAPPITPPAERVS